MVSHLSKCGHGGGMTEVTGMCAQKSSLQDHREELRAVHRVQG